jgi:glycosyltransferase involved in cell wall biosynthesis
MSSSCTISSSHPETRHNRWNHLLFTTKITGLALQREIHNRFTHLPIHPQNYAHFNLPILASSVTPLWTSTDSPSEWILTAGKIENLRVASCKLNGLTIPANTPFSFWKQIGYPGRLQGYVIGRELKQGCLIPSIAGGLCQLSNALYDLALKSGFDIIERHRHSHMINGSEAERNRDATIKWNYIDLQFKAPFDWGIDVDFTDKNMIIHFRSSQFSTSSNSSSTLFKIDLPTPHQPTSHDSSLSSQPSHPLRNCYSCKETKCHQNQSHVKHAQNHRFQAKGKTTYLIDESWPEFQTYLNQYNPDSSPATHIIFPFPSHFPKWGRRWGWAFPSYSTSSSSLTQTIPWKASLKRVLALKKASFSTAPIFKHQIQINQAYADALLKHIPLETTHLIIAQSLLPFLYQAGVCAGRTYDVLMSRLPFRALQARLDTLKTQYTQSPTLADFRVPSFLEEMEENALKKARRIITPHREIAQLFGNQSRLLEWSNPPKTPDSSSQPMSKHPQIEPTILLFPASLVARKGAYELKKIISSLNQNYPNQFRLKVMGKAIESESFIKDLKYTPFDGHWDSIDGVLYPSHIEHQPRILLRALSLDIPVITSSVCGLDENLQSLSINDLEDLEGFVRWCVQLEKRH